MQVYTYKKWIQYVQNYICVCKCICMEVTIFCTVCTQVYAYHGLHVSRYVAFMCICMQLYIHQGKYLKAFMYTNPGVYISRCIKYLGEDKSMYVCIKVSIYPGVYTVYIYIYTVYIYIYNVYIYIYIYIYKYIYIYIYTVYISIYIYRYIQCIYIF